MKNHYEDLVEKAGKSLGLLDVWAMEGPSGEAAHRITLKFKDGNNQDMKLDLPKIEIHQLLGSTSPDMHISVIAQDIRRRIDAGEAVLLTT